MIARDWNSTGVISSAQAGQPPFDGIVLLSALSQYACWLDHTGVSQRDERILPKALLAL